MRILFLLTTYPQPGKPVAADKMYLDLVGEFAARGHDTYVATLLERREDKDTFRYDMDGVRVLYVRCGNLFNVGPIQKGITLLSLSRRFMGAIHEFYKDIKFDLVLYPTPPITFSPVVRRLKREMGCSTYLILRDIFPQNARDLGMIKDPFTFWFFRRKERLLYDVSDHIGCMSQGNIDYVLQHNAINPRKLEILYNWEKLSPTQPPRDPGIRAKYGLEGKFVAVFGGNIGFAQELEFLLELAKLYRHRQDIVFLIVGRGVLRGKIAALVEQERLSNVVMHDFIPREDFDQILRTCDIGLVNLDRRFTIPNIPSKTVAYFSAGVPVLASIDAHTDYGRMLDDCGGGLWSVTGDLASYHRNFERLLNDPELRKRMGENGKRAVRERFSMDRAYDTIMGHFPSEAADPPTSAPPTPAAPAEGLRAREYTTKRACDLVVSILATLALALPLLVVILILRFTGEGEVWFRQERIGLGRRRFRVLKFVTMRKDSEFTGTRDITVRDDPRVLPFGRILRRTKINEVPQILNVLMGEMSIVGWRPLLQTGFDYYPEHVQRQIVTMKPGLTGIGSICFRDEEAITARAKKSPEMVYREDIAPYKGELELWYLRHQSFWLDLQLILLTAWAVLRPGSRLYEHWLKGLPKRPASLDL